MVNLSDFLNLIKEAFIDNDPVSSKVLKDYLQDHPQLFPEIPSSLSYYLDNPLDVRIEDPGIYLRVNKELEKDLDIESLSFQMVSSFEYIYLCPQNGRYFIFLIDLNQDEEIYDYLDEPSISLKDKLTFLVFLTRSEAFAFSLGINWSKYYTISVEEFLRLKEISESLAKSFLT